MEFGYFCFFATIRNDFHFYFRLRNLFHHKTQDNGQNIIGCPLMSTFSASRTHDWCEWQFFRTEKHFAACDQLFRITQKCTCSTPTQITSKYKLHQILRAINLSGQHFCVFFYYSINSFILHNFNFVISCSNELTLHSPVPPSSSGERISSGQS